MLDERRQIHLTLPIIARREILLLAGGEREQIGTMNSRTVPTD